MTAVFGARGLELAGALASDLAERYGTPLLVVDEEDIRCRCRMMRDLYPRVLFAVKAFTSHAIIRIVAEEGLDLLVSTDGELEACLRAGIRPARIVFHGNNKSDAELALAAETGVGLLIADNADELERIDRAALAAGRLQDVLIRVIPEVEADTHPSIHTGHATSKFGTPLDRALEAVKLAVTMPGLRFVGLHAHIGSQVLEIEPYLREVDTLVGFLAMVRDVIGVEAELLDVGGGFGIAYTDEVPAPPQAVARAIAERVEEAAASRGLAVPTLVVEPGRSVVGPAAVTLYRVGSIKEAGGRTFAAVDGGMSDNPRPALYDASYTVARASPPRSGGARPVTIVGRHCESGDVLADAVSLEDLRTGDLLAFAATGAYTYPMASNYNRVGRPAVVSVRDARSTLWLRREDVADLDRLETASQRPGPEAPPLPEGITIRPARASDAGSFLTFWKAIVAEGRFVRSEQVRHPRRVYRARFRRPWTDRDAQVVAVEGDRVVGHVFIQREEHPVVRHVASLGIAVAADRRGTGIGTALMAEAMRWATGVGVEKIVLSVYPHNRAAIALYRRFGFVEEGRLARQSRKSYGYEDEILMAVWLGTPDRGGEG
jgi:diaminopimelate decarboxylase